MRGTGWHAMSLTIGEARRVSGGWRRPGKARKCGQLIEESAEGKSCCGGLAAGVRFATGVDPGESLLGEPANAQRENGLAGSARLEAQTMKEDGFLRLLNKQDEEIQQLKAQLSGGAERAQAPA